MKKFVLILFYLLFFLGCDSKNEKKGLNVDDASRLLLESFINGDYEIVYACRDEEFRRQVSYESYLNYVDQINAYLKVNGFDVLSLDKKGDMYFYEFRYSFVMKGLRSNLLDFMVLEDDDGKLVCHDLGFRAFYTLNSPLKMNNE